MTTDQFEAIAEELAGIETKIAPAQWEYRALAANFGSDVVEALTMLAEESLELLVAAIAARRGLADMQRASGATEMDRRFFARVAKIPPERHEHAVAELLAQGQTARLERRLPVVGCRWLTEEVVERLRAPHPPRDAENMNAGTFLKWLAPTNKDAGGMKWVRRVETIFALEFPKVVRTALADLVNVRTSATHSDAGAVPTLTLWRATTWGHATSVLSLMLLGRLAHRHDDRPVGFPPKEEG